MKIKKTIIQIGASYGIVLDRVLLESANLDIGDEVWVDLEKVNKLPKNQTIKEIKHEVTKDGKKKM